MKRIAKSSMTPFLEPQVMQRANRPDEASSPARKAAELRTKGRRPNNVDQRHEQVVSLMLEQSSTVNEPDTNVCKCITDIGKQLQTCD